MSEPISVGDSDFDAKVLKAGVPTLVDFWAEWCAPCKALSPVVDEIAQAFDGRVQIAKMNIDENPNTPGQFAIRSIPTLLLFKNGEVVEQIVGLVGRDKVEEAINKHL